MIFICFNISVLEHFHKFGCYLIYVCLCLQWMEVVYGTASGAVHVIMQVFSSLLMLIFCCCCSVWLVGWLVGWFCVFYCVFFLHIVTPIQSIILFTHTHAHARTRTHTHTHTHTHTPCHIEAPRDSGQATDAVPNVFCSLLFHFQSHALGKVFDLRYTDYWRLCLCYVCIFLSHGRCCDLFFFSILFLL